MKLLTLVENRPSLQYWSLTGVFWGNYSKFYGLEKCALGGKYYLLLFSFSLFSLLFWDCWCFFRQDCLEFCPLSFGRTLSFWFDCCHSTLFAFTPIWLIFYFSILNFGQYREKFSSNGWLKHYPLSPTHRWFW